MKTKLFFIFLLLLGGGEAWAAQKCAIRDTRDVLGVTLILLLLISFTGGRGRYAWAVGNLIFLPVLFSADPALGWVFLFFFLLRLAIHYGKKKGKEKKKEKKKD